MFVTIRLHGVTSQKIVIFKVAALRASDVTVDCISRPIGTAEYKIRRLVVTERMKMWEK
jgi:hypothetical protein